jgi:hypothetical protein
MAITRGLTTLNEVKAILRLTDTVDDSLLETCIESASRQIESHCERVFTVGTATRVFAPQDSYVTEIDDLISLTTLRTSSDASETFDTTWAAKDYQLEPLNGVASGVYSPFTRIRAVDDYLFTVVGGEATVQVTGVFGYATAVPTDVKQACNLMAIRQFKRYDSPLGVAGFGDIGVVRVSRVDPDIESLLAPYRKLRFA